MTVRYKTIKEIKQMISQKEISNKEIIEEVYKLIDENSHLNAFINQHYFYSMSGFIRAPTQP